MNIRNIEISDISGVMDIYLPFINGTTVTFETEMPTPDEFAQRVINYQKFFPWIVSEENGMITGFAYASKYRERMAYQWVCEISIYIHSESKRKGVAKKLYQTLFEILKLQGICKVYAVISIPNPESVGFHEKMGFTWFATYKNVGNKFGQWCDVGWWELELNPPLENPLPPVNYPELDRKELLRIFETHH